MYCSCETQIGGQSEPILETPSTPLSLSLIPPVHPHTLTPEPCQRAAATAAPATAKHKSVSGRQRSYLNLEYLHTYQLLLLLLLHHYELYVMFSGWVVGPYISVANLPTLACVETCVLCMWRRRDQDSLRQARTISKGAENCCCCCCCCYLHSTLHRRNAVD